jgi:hypothetical protein
VKLLTYREMIDDDAAQLARLPVPDGTFRLLEVLVMTGGYVLAVKGRFDDVRVGIHARLRALLRRAGFAVLEPPAAAPGAWAIGVYDPEHPAAPPDPDNPACIRAVARMCGFSPLPT